MTDAIAEAASEKPRRGRPLGSGSYEELDMPLVSELDRRWRSGQSRTAAARELAERAYGPNTEHESKVARLVRRHRQYFFGAM